MLPFLVISGGALGISLTVGSASRMANSCSMQLNSRLIELKTQPKVSTYKYSIRITGASDVSELRDNQIIQTCKKKKKKKHR
jgi:hypothetical protein